MFSGTKGFTKKKPDEINGDFSVIEWHFQGLELAGC